jgi:hypothetical protein
LKIEEFINFRNLETEVGSLNEKDIRNQGHDMWAL